MRRKTIELDENQNPIDRLAERNTEIITNLQPKLQQFLDKEQAEIMSKSKKKWAFQFQMQIVEELHKYPLMSAEDFAEISADDIWDYYCKFHSLLSYYNMYTEIVPNAELFMSFMGINMRMYLNLKEGGYNQDEDIKDVINFLETEVLGNSWGAIEHGNADVKAVSKRISAKGVHEVISASEDKLIEKAEVSTPAQMMILLNSIVGGEQKKLNGAK
jgi:hypothetical protein